MDSLRPADRPEINQELWVTTHRVRMPNYQRRLDTHRIEIMAENFNPALLERLLCNQRPEDGEIYCVDGQHRFAMLLRMGYEEVPIALHVGWNENEEREMYEYLNSVFARRGLTAYDVFMAGGPEAREIGAILDKTGFHASPGTTYADPFGISAIRSLQRIRRTYGSDILLQTLRLVTEGWHNVQGRTQGVLLEAIARVLYYCDQDPNYSEHRMVETLHRVTPTVLIRDAAVRASTFRNTRRPLVLHSSSILLERYNEGTRAKIEAALPVRLEGVPGMVPAHTADNEALTGGRGSYPR